MTQEVTLHPEQDELSMPPIELLNKRLNRVNLALAQLQAVNHNTFTNMQKDVVFALHVIGAIREHLPTSTISDAVAAAEAATGQAVGAYNQQPVRSEPPARDQPSLHNAQHNHVETGATLPGLFGSPESQVQRTPSALPMHEARMPAELRQQPAPSRIQEAADTARQALDVLGQEARRVHGERLAQEAQPAPPARVPNSVAAAAGHGVRPTREGTPSVAEQLQKNHDAAEFIGHFIGTGSVFSKYLSPSILSGGKGFVEPGYGGFYQYNDDALKISPQSLQQNDWPSGFYRDSSTRLQQFLIMNGKVQVLVTNLPNTNVEVFVSFAPFTERVNVRHLTVQQMQVVFGIISATFIAGERAAGTPI